MSPENSWVKEGEKQLLRAGREAEGRSKSG